MDTTPLLYVLSKSSDLSKKVTRYWPGSADVRWVNNPLDLVAMCLEVQPMLVVVELLDGCDTWLAAIDYLAELPDSPRRLLLAEPGVIDEVLQETFRQGLDTISLWPGTDEDLTQILRNTFLPLGGGSSEIPFIVS